MKPDPRAWPGCFVDLCWKNCWNPGGRSFVPGMSGSSAWATISRLEMLTTAGFTLVTSSAKPACLTLGSTEIGGEAGLGSDPGGAAAPPPPHTLGASRGATHVRRRARVRDNKSDQK